MGLNGPVRTVRLQAQDYNWENSRWEPMGDPVHNVQRYDANGRCLTWHLDPGSGWRAYGLPLPPATAKGRRQVEIVRKDKRWKTRWDFDDEGRLARFESFALREDGSAHSSDWQQYSYDSQGRVKELAYWADWGWSPEQTEPYPPIRLTYWFDDAGRIGGWTNAAEPRSRTVLTYDEKGRLVKQVEEKVDGNITYVTKRTWDRYDRQGNWTVSRVTQLWRTEDGDEPQDESVTRRWITYRRPIKSKLPTQR